VVGGEEPTSEEYRAQKEYKQLKVRDIYVNYLK